MRVAIKNTFAILGALAGIGEIVVSFIPKNQFPPLVLSTTCIIFEIISKLVEIQLPKSRKATGPYEMASTEKHIPFPSLVVSLIMISLAFTVADVLIGTIIAVLSFIAMFIVYNIYQKKGFNDEISPLQRFFIAFALVALLIVEYIKICLAVMESMREMAFIFFGVFTAILLIATIIILIVLRKKNSPMKYLLTFVTNAIGIFLVYILSGISNFGLITLALPLALPAILPPFIIMAFNTLFYLLARIPINIMEKTSANEFATEYSNGKYDDQYHNTYVK